MQPTEIQRYCAAMEEVKRRLASVTSVIDGDLAGGYAAVAIEGAYLQLRMILELIALASLVANRAVFSRVYQNFAEYWNADRLIKDLSQVNPKFYPQPIVERQSPDPKVKSVLDPRPDGYLTPKELVTLYKMCGAILHARNPYRQPVAFQEYHHQLQSWRDRIVNLLNVHLIQLVDSKNLYLVHMQGADGKVHMYTFAPHAG